MPVASQSISLDLDSLVDANFNPIAGYSNGDYTSSIAYGGESVVAVDLASLPSNLRSAITSSSLTLTAKFTTSTTNITKHTLDFEYILDNNDLDTFFSSTASTDDRTKAAIRFTTAYSYYEIKTYDLRQGSVFAGSINQEVQQSEDVSSAARAALNKGETTIYFVWGTSAGIDKVKGFNITGTYGRSIYSLAFTDSASSTQIRTTGQAVTPFTTIAVGSGGEIDAIDLGYGTGDLPAPTTLTATPFKITSTVVDARTTIKVHQDKASLGFMAGAAKNVNADGSADYIVSGTADTISKLLAGLSFNPTATATALNSPLAVTFTFTEIDNGQNKDLGLSKTVLIATDQQTVARGETVSAVIANAGQTLTVAGGGRSYSTTLLGGTEIVQKDGYASTTDIYKNGYQRVLGQADNVFVGDGGKQTVSDGGFATGTTLNGAYLVYAYLGNAPTAWQVVEAGAVALGTKVTDGGWQHVYGTSTAATVTTGGWQTIYGGGKAYTTNVVGGKEVVSASALAEASTVSGGGLIDVNNGGTAKAATAGLAGTVQVRSGGTLADGTIAGGSVVLKAGAIASGSLTFTAGTVDTLEIDATPAAGRSVFGAKLLGVAAGDKIDLAGLVYASSTSAQLTKDALTVTSGGTTYVVTMGGTVAGRFLVSDDGHGGTQLTASGFSTIIEGAKDGMVQEAGGVANAVPGAPLSSGTLSMTYFGAASSFVAKAAGTASTGGYGTYALTAAGAWVYTLDNANAAVQALNTGDTLTDTFTARTAEGGVDQVVSVLIKGLSDAAVITGQTTGSVIEWDNWGGGSSTGVATGRLTVTDVDSPATFREASLQATTYGSFDIGADGAWTYRLDDRAANVQALKAGQIVTDVFTVKTADGTSQAITITITGINDVPTVTGSVSGTVKEAGGIANGTAGTPVATGQLTAVDVDSPNGFQAVASAASGRSYGTYSVTADGLWTYTLNDANPAVQALNVGRALTDYLTILTADGTSKTVSITINGANDAATIGGVLTGTVTEAGGVANAAAGVSLITGKATSTDVDNPSNTFLTVAETVTASGYGSYAVRADGGWAYRVNDANPTVQALNTLDRLTDTFTIKTGDGTAGVVTITINGANDAAVISGTKTGTVTEAAAGHPGAPVATGTLTASDIDNTPGFRPITAGTPSNGTYGTVSLTAEGVWTYTLNNAHPAVDALKAGDGLTDAFAVTAVDGTTETVTIRINGANDAPVAQAFALAGTATDGQPYLVKAADLLAHVSDADSTALSITGLSVADGHGSLVANGNGTWTYTPAASDPAAVHLAYTASDGSNSASSLATLAVQHAADPGTPVGGGTGTSGQQSLTLHVSEDAWGGDAQFVVLVDGRQVGGVQTATASHAAGASQAVTISGDFAVQPNQVAVKFLNDLYGGDAAHDRNLYVDSLTVNGATYRGEHATNTAGPSSFPGEAAALLGSEGQLTFDMSHTVTLRVSEDAYQGDAQFIVLADGHQVGGVQTVTASHAAGQAQDITFRTDLGTPSQVAVKFINDMWGGDAAHDRNLYVESLTVDGVTHGLDNAVNTAGPILSHEALLYGAGPTGDYALTFLLHA